jgi:hypothetical protein
VITWSFILAYIQGGKKKERKEVEEDGDSDG